MKKLLLLTFVLLLSQFKLSGQAVVGDWKGILTTNGVELRLSMHIEELDTGIIGTFSILDQGMNDLKMVNPSFKENVLKFSVGIGVKYEGSLEDDGKLHGSLDMGPQGEAEMDFERGKVEILRPQEPKAPFPYEIREVSIPNPEAEGVTLAGTLTLPKTEGPYPAVVLVTGSGPNNRDEEIMLHKPFWVIADFLSRNGVAVLRYDDRGCYASTGKFALATGFDLASDARAVAHYFRQIPGLKISKMGIVGHSEGGMLAPLIAEKNPDIDFLVCLAGPGMSGSGVLMEQSELIMRSMGTSEAEIAHALKTNAALYKASSSNASPKKLRPKLRKILLQANKDAKAQGLEEMSESEIQSSINTMGSGWWRAFLRMDPSPYFEKTKIPVLALNGTKDIQVPAESNLAGIDGALKKAGNQHYKLVKLEGLNHLFQLCDACTVTEYGKLEETFSQKALDIMLEWIKGLK